MNARSLWGFFILADRLFSVLWTPRMVWPTIYWWFFPRSWRIWSPIFMHGWLVRRTVLCQTQKNSSTDRWSSLFRCLISGTVPSIAQLSVFIRYCLRLFNSERLQSYWGFSSSGCCPGVGSLLGSTTLCCMLSILKSVIACVSPPPIFCIFMVGGQLLF